MTEHTPVAIVVGTDGTAVVASDGAASVLAGDSRAAVAIPPLRAFTGPDGDTAREGDGTDDGDDPTGRSGRKGQGLPFPDLPP